MPLAVLTTGESDASRKTCILVDVDADMMLCIRPVCNLFCPRYKLRFNTVACAALEIWREVIDKAS
jgi:hypothetical protein